jgi:threonine/homoserine/homoserine lactone efflux protein
MGIQNYYLFLITALLFIMTPGIDTMFILNKAIGQGRKAGLYSTLGINSGILVHTIFAALGLSLIVAKSAMAFAIVKYCGAAYLIYLGISSLIKGKKLDLSTAVNTQESYFKNYYTGLVTNTLNPKVALFFLSFFPQFIAREALGTPKPFIMLSITYCLLGVLWFTIVTLLAAAFSGKLTGNPKFADRLNKISAGVYILMGVKIALSKR